jgi:selenocysteine lyase/cysteine desulfurase
MRHSRVMKISHSISRRSFLGSVGAPTALRLLPGVVGAGGPTPGSASSRDRTAGLAAADDYLFSPGLVYLQTASLGPTPRPVLERTLAAWRELEQNPVLYGYGAQEHAMEDVRSQAASFLGCKKDELVLTRSTSEGMNWVAQGLGLTAGDRVLTTDQEHPGGRACWDYVARKLGVVIDTVKVPPGENDARAVVGRFAKEMTPRTRVVSFSHLLTSTGLRMPVAEICAVARAHGSLAVVDGAQAAGGVVVDVKALGCHVYATSGHKWLLGPKGTGLLYLSEELGARVDPIALQDGRAAYSASSGVSNLPGVIGLGAALDYLSALGMAKVEAHNLAIRNRAHEALGNVQRIRIVSAPPGPLASPLLTYELPPGVESRALQLRLMQAYKVVVKIVPAQWLNGQRISTHLFNSADDVDKLVVALKAELA